MHITIRDSSQSNCLQMDGAPHLPHVHWLVTHRLLYVWSSVAPSTEFCFDGWLTAVSSAGNELHDHLTRGQKRVGCDASQMAEILWFSRIPLIHLLIYTVYMYIKLGPFVLFQHICHNTLVWFGLSSAFHHLFLFCSLFFLFHTSFLHIYYHFLCTHNT